MSSTRFTLSRNEKGIKSRIAHMEKCVREGSYIFFGTDRNDLFITGNVFRGNDEMNKAVYCALFGDETLEIFEQHVSYLNSLLQAHPKYKEKEVRDE